jgi:hypothetical protein
MKWIRRALALATILGTALYLRHRDWGSTETERLERYPGEDMVPEPSDARTRAVAIAAPPEVTWSWLVQMGQNRGGMYSYDWLENLIGLDIHTTDEIRAEWQDLAPDNKVFVVPPGRLGMPEGYAFGVAEVEPPHHLVLRQAPPEHPWNGVWTFVVEPDGPGCSRLVSRSRSERPAADGAALLRVATLLMDPITLVMTRRMLLGIKQRAERGARDGEAPAEARDGSKADR